ncbi:MAG: hypothetical protein PHO20_04875 [Candidatus Peribacteraceae bacterium]|nr:hypothetical protein [Candidatus Peribacteraceae bacterium]MDD5740069.1 hypothetical protein [Candidatus Peribacteraceae bacterium]
MDRKQESGGNEAYTYFKWVKGTEEVEMGWTSAGTFLVTRHPHDVSRGGFAAHILSPVAAGKIDDSVHRFLRASRKKLGEIYVVARGAAVFTHWDERLQAAQRNGRRVLEDFFAQAGIPMDAQWAADDTLTEFTFDAENGTCHIETMPYCKTTEPPSVSH